MYNMFLSPYIASTPIGKPQNIPTIYTLQHRGTAPLCITRKWFPLPRTTTEHDGTTNAVTYPTLCVSSSTKLPKTSHAERLTSGIPSCESPSYYTRHKCASDARCMSLSKSVPQPHVRRVRPPEMHSTPLDVHLFALMHFSGALSMYVDMCVFMSAENLHTTTTHIVMWRHMTWNICERLVSI